MDRPCASWLQQVDQNLKQMGEGPGISLEDCEMKAPGAGAESGRGDALLWRILTRLWTCCFYFTNNGWRPSMSAMSSGLSLLTYLVLLIVWHPALLSKLSADGIQGELHTWLSDLLHSRRQHVALNGILSSPLPVKDGVPQDSVLGPVLFLIVINDLSDFLENYLYLFADDSTLCHDIPHPSNRKAAASSLYSDLDKNQKMVKHLEYVLES